MPIFYRAVIPWQKFSFSLLYSQFTNVFHPRDIMYWFLRSITTLIEKASKILKKFQIHIAVDDPSFIPIRSDWLDAINLGCGNALLNGPIMGHPVYDVSIFLKQFVTSGGRLSTTVITACASKCIHDALKIAQIQILEPVMFVEVLFDLCDFLTIWFPLFYGEKI